jgi:hypothetical protein
LARWLTSTKHLVGAGAALVGPALAVAGVVSAPVGLVLIVPLYLAGALAAPARSKRAELQLAGVDSDDVLARLAKLEKRVDGRVPALVSKRVHHIADTIRNTIPRVDALGPASTQIHTLVQTATDYLPSALDAYMRLPREYADKQPIDGRRTSLDVLSDQLELLSSKMDEVFDAVCRSDADALVAHERFLSDKFAPGSLDLGPPPSRTSLSAPTSPPDPPDLSSPAS